MSNEEFRDLVYEDCMEDMAYHIEELIAMVPIAKLRKAYEHLLEED